MNGFVRLRDLTVVFVVHGGELELKSAILAASLRARLGPDIRIIAAVARPISDWGDISHASVRLYQRLGVECQEIENPFGMSYPIGNKFAALALGRAHGYTLFLDSDMLCLEAPDFTRLCHVDVAFKAADMALVPVEVEYWRRIFALFDMNLPPSRLLTTCTSELMPHYFNAGFLWVHDAPRFAERWLEISKRISEEPDIPHKWPWLDQLALPVAVENLGYRVEILAERYNFPLHLKSLVAGSRPFFCHYHDASVLAREPELIGELKALQQRWPELAEVIATDAGWQALLKPPGTDASLSGLDVIITGLPRSGTSFLCRLLSERQDTVVINEPSSIFPALARGARPWGIPLIYGEIRRDLLAGKPVLNKHMNGRLVDDTARGLDSASPYWSNVRNPAFTLGIKNTLAYLAHLPSILKVMPNARCVALIRHPYDCLESWSRTFPHLRFADVQSQPVGNPDDPGLTGWQRKALLDVVATECLATRRALWWRFLALQILEAGTRVRWLRYEDLMEDPPAMAELLMGDASLPALAPIRWRGEMDRQERTLIAGVVCDVAERLQYVL
ncbi:sulfotransferase family protein [Pseudomonas schmalbachii]|uniref:Sulfotransferase n=1 Tax=Pseudomonas schmalbachii TaxID=2816993 RepID=A0ABS3TLP6_9PSED|nr:sulfotransferase [Pseudomonas schmalbachii]MBO3274586.1 sulfotransferase [Pseudomonas schmalbachii]